MCADSVGNIYIADTVNNRIRKVGVNGIITTIAGDGNAGFSGDGSDAISAQLNQPTGLCIDSLRNLLYIADCFNHRIRKVDFISHTITTIAGSGAVGDGNGAYSGDGAAATSARLDGPTGVCVDSSGIVYIADRKNSRIRKVGLDGKISTIAGDGTSGYDGTSAKLSYPWRVCVDIYDNIYIADTQNSRIRKMDPQTGIITLIAGNGVPGFGGDGGPATDAELGAPTGLYVDSSGNVYIVDIAASLIRKVDTSGIITKISGTGVEGYTGDEGLAYSAQLNRPASICLDPAGNIYVADSLNNRIRKIYPA